jgi:hypothetical protein
MGYAFHAMGDEGGAIGHPTASLDMFNQLQLAHYAQRAREALDSCQSQSDHGLGSVAKRLTWGC